MSLSHSDEGNVLSLTVTLSEDVTYVCRVSNRAGRDADIVSFRTCESLLVHTRFMHFHLIKLFFSANAQFVWSVTNFSDVSSLTFLLTSVL